MDDEKMVRVKMLADRRGWFWPTPLVAGQEYELPVNVAEYLVGLDAAELAGAHKAKAKAEVEAAPVVAPPMANPLKVAAALRPDPADGVGAYDLPGVIAEYLVGVNAATASKTAGPAGAPPLENPLKRDAAARPDTEVAPVVHTPVVHAPVVHATVVHAPVVHEATVEPAPVVHETVVHAPRVTPAPVHESKTVDLTAPAPKVSDMAPKTPASGAKAKGA